MPLHIVNSAFCAISPKPGVSSQSRLHLSLSLGLSNSFQVHEARWHNVFVPLRLHNLSSQVEDETWESRAGESQYGFLGGGRGGGASAASAAASGHTPSWSYNLHKGSNCKWKSTTPTVTFMDLTVKIDPTG
jgi:hypothetical protein